MWPPYREAEHEIVKIMMHGMTDGSATDLLPLARSWIRPPELRVQTGGRSRGYDPAQRAYVVACDGPHTREAVRLHLAAGAESPAVNPAVVLEGWGDRAVTVEINGRRSERGGDYRAGFRHALNGLDLVVWVERTATSPLDITLYPGPVK
jgi:hypothetical protein